MNTKSNFKSITKEFLIINAQELIMDQEVLPAFNEYEYRAHVIKEFLSWENFLDTVNQRMEDLNNSSEVLKTEKREVIVQNSMKEKISNEYLITDIKKQAKELGRTPVAREYQYKYYAIRNFGTWSAFLKQAGLTTVKTGRPKKVISDEFLINDVQDKAKKLGRTPEIRGYQYKNYVIQSFGTWTTFLKEAGLRSAEPQKSKKIKLNEFLIEEIQRKTNELGRIPVGKEFDQFYSAIRQFGTWNEFLKQADLLR